MKILVFSDSHRRPERMLQVLAKIPCDLVFFLGDGLGDLLDIQREHPALPILSVPGNCDFAPANRPAVLLTEEGGKRFFLTHGHLHGVKQGLEALRQASLEHDADVTLFGHTHQPLVERSGDRWWMNPGSIGKASYPRLHPTYGEILLEDGVLQCMLREVEK